MKPNFPKNQIFVSDQELLSQTPPGSFASRCSLYLVGSCFKPHLLQEFVLTNAGVLLPLYLLFANWTVDWNPCLLNIFSRFSHSPYSDRCIVWVKMPTAPDVFFLNYRICLETKISFDLSFSIVFCLIYLKSWIIVLKDSLIEKKSSFRSISHKRII